MKRIRIRNKKIKELRKKGFTLGRIAKRYKITNERVRQILLPKVILETSYCKSHKKTFLTVCQYCEMEREYKKRINKLAKQSLETECIRLSRPDRRVDIVIQRKILVKYLRDRYKMSFPQIARLLKRDHTSISSLYYKN